MTMSARFMVLAGALLISNVACAIDESPLAGSRAASSTSNQLATNQLATNALTTNQLATNQLATNQLATNQLATNGLTSGELADPEVVHAMEDPGAREVMRYLVSCALAPDMQVTWTSKFTGLRETWNGGLSLCPDWFLGPLSLACQERVSACLLARNNAFGTSVLFSMRGRVASGDAIELGREVAPHTKRPGTHDDVLSFIECAPGTPGVQPDCGWQPAQIGRCTPHAKVHIAAGNTLAGSCQGDVLGQSAGDTVLRVCDGTSGCDPGDPRVLGENDDACGQVEPSLSFACPESGYFSVMIGAAITGKLRKGRAGASSDERLDFPASEDQVFRWREGAFYGNLFTGLNPAKPQVRVNGIGEVENWNADLQQWVPGTELSQQFDGVVYQQMFACASANWAAPEAYLMHRVCAGEDPKTGLYRRNCAAEAVGTCRDVCAYDDGKPVLGDHDFQDCHAGGRVWSEPLTTILNRPCDLLGAGDPSCATVYPVSELDW